MKLTNLYKKNHFYKTTISILIFVITMVLLVVISITFRFEKTLKSTINEYNEETLVNISNKIEESNLKTKELILALNNTPQVNLLKFVDNDDVEIYKSVKMLKQISPYSHAYLQSIYIYNTVADKIYTFGKNVSYYSSENFPDKDIFTYLNSGTKYNTSPAIRKLQTEEGPVDVYTYIVSETKTRNNNIGEAIIINIRIDDIFTDIVSTQKSNIALFDSSSLKLFKNYGKINKADIEELFDNQIIEKSGHFSTTVGGDSYIVTYTTLNQPKWIVCSITPTDEVLAPIKQTKNIIFIILLVLLIIILLTSYTLSVYLYKPLKLIVSKLPKSKDIDEFEQISNYLSDNKKELIKYNMQMQKNNPIVKTKFISDLIKGAYDNKEEITDQFEALDINFNVNGNYILTSITVDDKVNYLDHFSSLEQLNIRNLNISYINKLINEKYNSEVHFNNDYSRFTLLIEVSNELNKDNLYRYLSKCFNITNQHFVNTVGYTLSFFTTKVFQIEEIYSNYNYLPILQNEKFFHGTNSIIFQDKLILKSDEAKTKDLKLDSLLDNIINLKKDEVERNLKEIFNDLKNYKYDICISMIYYINTSLYETFWKIEKNSNEKLDLNYSHSMKILTNAEYLSQVYNTFINTCNFVMDTLSEYKSDYRTDLVNQIKEFIDKNYNDFNITATYIADNFNLTTAYIGKIFRNATGNSISNAITEVRLEKACELLNNTKLTVNEITREVGWENNKYFYNKFKIKYGVTPFQYRNK